jgi:benzoate membrane transport protein
MNRTLHQLRADISLSALVAGLLAVLVSCAGPIVIVFQAARLAHLSTEMTASWIWAILVGSGISGLILSWKLRTPVITAWSTPGAALLVVMLPGIALPQAIGAYLLCAAIVTAVGVSGLFDRFVERIPRGIAAAMLAGILLRFGTEVFTSISVNPFLVLAMLLVFLIGRRIWPRYVIASVMAAGIAIAIASGTTHLSELRLALAAPLWVTPAWSWHAMLSLGLPLALVALTGQYVPGMAVLRASGYRVPASGIIGTTGLVSFLLAPFGAHGITLAAITAAICTGEDAHQDANRRYIAGMACGAVYIAVGIFGGTLALLFQALPAELIAALTGLALLGAITTGLVGIADDGKHRDASIITFLATASGMTFLGLGSAFWGLALGAAAYAILHRPWGRHRDRG